MQELEGLKEEKKLSVDIARDALAAIRAGSTKTATEITACPQNSSEKLCPQLPLVIAPYLKALLVLFGAACGFLVCSGVDSKVSIPHL